MKIVRSLFILTEVHLVVYIVLRVDQLCERRPAVWSIAGYNEAGRHQSRLGIHADSHVYRLGMAIPCRGAKLICGYGMLLFDENH